MTTDELLDVLSELSVGVRLPTGLEPKNPSFNLWAAGVLSSQDAYNKLFTSQLLRMHSEMEAEQENTLDLSEFNTITEATDIEMHRLQVRVAPGGEPESFETLFAGHPNDVAEFTDIFNAHIAARE